MAETMSKLEWLVTQKSARDGRRYTNRDIANATGVSESTISRLMNNKNIESTTIRVARLVCEWLECDLGDLLTIREVAK